jgi:hypothetical protein
MTIVIACPPGLELDVTLSARTPEPGPLITGGALRSTFRSELCFVQFEAVAISEAFRLRRECMTTEAKLCSCNAIMRSMRLLFFENPACSAERRVERVVHRGAPRGEHR